MHIIDVIEDVDRRSFLLGVSALAALCPIELRTPLTAGSTSRVARSKLDRYTIDLANADRRLDVYNVRLRNYASAGKTPTIPGPRMETRGGHTLRVTLRNRITQAAGVIDGDMDQAPDGLDPHNNPHGRGFHRGEPTRARGQEPVTLGAVTSALLTRRLLAAGRPRGNGEVTASQALRVRTGTPATCSATSCY